MTAQSHDLLHYKGEKYGMASEPLYDYLEQRKDIKLVAPHTGCSRGYFGQWEIREGKLYLVHLKAYIGDMMKVQEVDITYLFPGQLEIFAKWYNGKIRLPDGERLEYVHGGYASLYERDKFLEFENGQIVREYVVDNADQHAENIRRDKERRAEITNQKIRQRNTKLIANCIVALAFALICIAIYFLIVYGSAFAFILASLLTVGLIYMVIRAFKAYKRQAKKPSMTHWLDDLDDLYGD